PGGQQFLQLGLLGGFSGSALGVSRCPSLFLGPPRCFAQGRLGGFYGRPLRRLAFSARLLGRLALRSPDVASGNDCFASLSPLDDLRVFGDCLSAFKEGLLGLPGRAKPVRKVRNNGGLAHFLPWCEANLECTNSCQTS